MRNQTQHLSGLLPRLAWRARRYAPGGGRRPKQEPPRGEVVHSVALGQRPETRGGVTGSPLKAVLLILGLVAAGLLIEQLTELLLAVVISVIVALPLGIGASLLERLHIPRAVGAVITLLVGLGVIGLLAVYLTPAFIHQVDDFVGQIPSTVRGIESIAHHSFGLRRGAVAGAAQRFADRYTRHPSDLLGPLSSVGLSLATILAAIVVILISALYMAISPDPLVNGLVRLFAPAHRQDAHRVLGRIRTAWVGWLRGVMLDMLVLGGLLFLGMSSSVCRSRSGSRSSRRS